MSIKNFVRQAFHYTGGTAAFRKYNQDSLRICMYHRFPQNSRLEQQCRHLKKFYQPMSLTDATEWLTANGPLPPNAVVVTADDGYRDFITTAHPIFTAFEIPITVYLATDLMDHGAWLWSDQVSYLFEHSNVPELEFAAEGAAPLQLRLDSLAARQEAAFQVKERLKSIPDQERRNWLGRLPTLLQVDLPAKAPENFEPMTWDDVRKVAGRGVAFGAHTKSHPILSQIESEQEIKEEICGSKARIEEETGNAVDHFCYPNGKWDDFDGRSEKAVRACGFRTAVTTEPGFNCKIQHPFRLLRFAFTPNYDEVKFAGVLAGSLHV